MSRYWSEFPRYEQPDAGELKRKSAASKKKAQAKGKVLEPVTIKGRKDIRACHDQRQEYRLHMVGEGVVR